MNHLISLKRKWLVMGGAVIGGKQTDLFAPAALAGSEQRKSGVERSCRMWGGRGSVRSVAARKCGPGRVHPILEAVLEGMGREKRGKIIRQDGAGGERDACQHNGNGRYGILSHPNGPARLKAVPSNRGRQRIREFQPLQYIVFPTVSDLDV